ncbi:MAG: hypothetical protein KH138_14130, partial [Firmicutes bacterium]|nr:hypothetical protein [Bacillota bacterium]
MTGEYDRQSSRRLRSTFLLADSLVWFYMMLTEVLLIRERRAAKISQLSFRLSVNAEDIHLGPVVNGEGLTHGPLADQLALGFVHD